MLTESINIDDWLKQNELKLTEHANKCQDGCPEGCPEGCRCDDCMDNHEEAEEYDEATGFEY